MQYKVDQNYIARWSEIIWAMKYISTTKLNWTSYIDMTERNYSAAGHYWVAQRRLQQS